MFISKSYSDLQARFDRGIPERLSVLIEVTSSNFLKSTSVSSGICTAFVRFRSTILLGNYFNRNLKVSTKLSDIRF